MSANVLTIAPNFVPGSGEFFFTSKELNSIQRAQYTDTFGFYQNLFGLYTYMPMNRKNKYVVHSPKGQPLVWQPYTACSYDPTGSLTIGRRELEPEPIYMKEQFCHDELFDSCYEQMVEYDRAGDVDLNSEGVRLFNLLIDELLANAAYGWRITAAGGQLYDVDTVEYSTSNTANITDLFKRTHGTFQGWLSIMKALAAVEYPWLDVPLVDESDFDGLGFNGDILATIDELVKQAPRPLRRLINRGGIVQNSRFRFYPLLIVSDFYFNAIVDRYNTESTVAATNRVRITYREFGGEMSPTPQRVYYIDGRLPVIPLDDINGFDDFLKGDTHFMGIVASGNIQLGASFASLPEDIEGNDIGVSVTRNNDKTRDDYGKYTVLSHALSKVALADPNYAVGSITHTVPA